MYIVRFFAYSSFHVIVYLTMIIFCLQFVSCYCISHDDYFHLFLCIDVRAVGNKGNNSNNSERNAT